MPFRQLVIATGNSGKLREIQHMLNDLEIEVLAQSVFNVPEAEEPHCTFIENALAKARHASRLTGLPALADDSGICVQALQGAPGVISARYADEQDGIGTLPANTAPDDGKQEKLHQDERNNAKLLQALHGINARHAYYYCVMVLVRHAEDPQPLISEGIWSGEILQQARGEGGFGYDPIFVDDKTGKTGAELPMEIKNRISHRGQALANMLHKLQHFTG